ncbi:MAG: aminoglycoside phosphotransferase family protein [Sphaerochaetaceae bacterium]
MDIQEIIGEFDIPGEFVEAKANHEGHINGTFICTFSDGAHYTLQHINKNVFANPEEVMENIYLVTSHIQQKISGLPGRDKRCLTIIRTKRGGLCHVDDAGEYWRVYRYIERVRTFNTITERKEAYLLGKAVGSFQNQLSDFDGRKLHITIPNFHNMNYRYEQLAEAFKADPKGRTGEALPELDYLMDNKKRGCAIWNGWKNGLYPTRVTHNDTKMNNVLFSEDGKEALCVIDLDTVMPGTILFDTGDMIRTATNTAMEDEPDATKVMCDIRLYHALLDGYLNEADPFLTDDEFDSLAESGRTITQIMAVRFLTDYIAGDVYYHIDRPEHNLDRARTQIALMKSMDSQWGDLTRF